MNQTRRVYRFHETVPLVGYALRRRAPATLRGVLARVWERYGRGRVPTLRFGYTGTTSLTHVYWGGDFEIRLTRPHQNLHILLHEIAHCLHPNEKAEHGPRFMATYIRLMAEFARESEAELLINAGLYGIKVYERREDKQRG